MAYSIDENCLACNSTLTSNGQCPSCDARTVEQNDVINLKSHENRLVENTIQADFQVKQNRKDSRPAFLINKATKERFELSVAVSKVGRDRANHISVSADHHMSRFHAWVIQNKGKFWVEDIGSTNGTLLNGHPITSREKLSAGDRITFGKTELIFVME